MKMLKRWIFLGTIFFLSFSSVAMSAEGAGDGSKNIKWIPKEFESGQVKARWGGYAKSLAQRTKTQDDKGYFTFIQRLRLKSDVQYAKNLRGVFEFDQEIYQGNALGIESVRGPIEKGRRDFLDLSHTAIDATEVIYRYDVYRAYLAYQNEYFRLKVGRQRINWQRTKFWNPVDVWNPLTPIQIETDERPGIDALNLTIPYFPNPQRGNLEFILNPDRSFHHTNFGFRLPVRVPIRDFTWEFAPSFSEFKRDEIYGFSTRGQIGGFGLKSESTVTNSHLLDKTFLKSSISGDYAWANGTGVTLEYFYNGGNQSDPTGALRAASTQIFTTQKHFVNFRFDYEHSTVLKGWVAVIYDAEGNSFFVNPRIDYNLLENLNFVIGSQIFMGRRKNTEFGSLKNLYYAWLQYYF